MSGPDDDPDLGSCGHALGEKVVTGDDGTVWCCTFCHARARPAIHLRLVLAAADRFEQEQAEARRAGDREWHRTVLNGAKKS